MAKGSSKPKLIKGSENWTKAISFVESGGALSAILSKYDVTSDDMLTLKVHEPRWNNWKA